VSDASQMNDRHNCECNVQCYACLGSTPLAFTHCSVPCQFYV